MQNPTKWQRFRRPGVIHLAVVIAYVGLTFVMTWPLAAHVFTAIPGDGFDGWQNYWNLWWLKTALIDRVSSPFYTDMLYAPTGVGLYFHTLNPLNGLMAMPVQLSAGPLAAYNSVVLVSWTLSGYGAFLLCLWLLRPSRRDTPRRASSEYKWRARYAGAFLAGVVYAFAPFHMAHLLGHMQVMSLEWIPFYILFLLRGMAAAQRGERWLHDALLAGLFLVFNGLSDWYFVLYLFLFTALAALCAWISGWVRMRAGTVRGWRAGVRSLADALATPAVAGLVFVVVLSPILWPMVREATQFSFMVRPATDLFILSASLMDYAIPSRMHTLLRESSAALPGNQIAPVSERTIAVGYVVLALALAGVALQRRRSMFWLLAALFFALLSLGPRMHFGNIDWSAVPNIGDTVDADAEAASWTLFGVLNRTIPFMRISRSVSRYALMVELSAALLAGFGLHGLMLRMRRGAGKALAAFALVAVLFEFWVAPYPLSEPDTPEFYTELAGEPGTGAVLNLPMNYDRPGYLLYQTVHGRPLTVAYISRDDPRTLTERVPVLQHFRHLGPDIVGGDPVPAGMTILNDLGVEYVVLDRYKMPGGKEREYTEALAAALFAGQEPRYADERLMVYAVPPEDDAQPYVELGPLNWGPLLTEADGTPAGRTIGDGPACATVRHADGETDVAIDYLTLPGTMPSGYDSVVASITNSADAVLAALDAAPKGSTVTIRLDQPGGEDPAFCIQATEPGIVRVKQIRLAEQ